MQKTIQNQYKRTVDFRIPMVKTWKELEKMVAELATGKLEKFYIPSEESIMTGYSYETDGKSLYVATEIIVSETLFTKTSKIEKDNLAEIITRYVALHGHNASSFYSTIKEKSESLAYEVVLQGAYNGDTLEDLTVKQLVQDNVMTLEMACALLKYVDTKYIKYLTGEILHTILTEGLDNL